MNPQDQDSPQNDLPGANAPVDADTPDAKPRRKRSPRAADNAPIAASAPAPAAAPAEEIVKPKRAPRRKVADADADADADGDGDGDANANANASTAAPAVVEPAPAVAEAAAPAALPLGVATALPPDDAPKPARPRRRAAAAVAADAGVADEASPAVPVAAAPAAAEQVFAAADGGQGRALAATPADAAPVDAAAPDLADVPPDAEGAGGVDGDSQRRRNRSRRRGRRNGADREPRAEGAGPDEPGLLTITATPGDDDEDDDETVGAGAAAPEAVLAEPLDAADTFAAVLSGDYDAQPAVGPADGVPERRVLAAEPDAPKLHKVLAQAGIGSRRDMEALIAEGQVMVNGQPAHVGQRISFGDRISVAGKQIKVRIAPPPPRIIAYHKPVGEVVTHDDPQHRPTVFRRLPRLPHGKWQSVGRLDINTEGLLLFTNSGELANQLMHPRFGVEREYAVRVLGTLETEGRQRLIVGVEIDGQRAGFKSIEDGGGEGVNRWYRVVITEGRNREVRKLFDKVGLGVSRLIRIRYGCVVLPRGLRRGLFVDLNEAEVREVRRLAAVTKDAPGAGAGAGSGPRPPRPEVGLAAGPRDGQAPRGQGGAQPQGGNPARRNGPPQRQDRPDRPDRPPRQQADRPPRPERQGGPNGPNNPGGPIDRSPNDRGPARRNERRDRIPDISPDRDGDRDTENFAAIPNPLMQTFDKRAIREARQPRREIPEDGPIPNPLEQTYDKRFVQKPRGFGGGDGGPRKGGGGGAGGQPDPMKTSMGYIGADAFVRKFQGNGGGGGGGGGGGRRGGGGGTGGGGGSGGGGGGGRRGGR